MSHLNFLERFEPDEVVAPFSPPLQDLPGYDAGYEAGLADAAQQNGQLSAALIDRLTEMQFGYAEAQSAMMSALVPFVTALSHQILPALSDELTRAHVKEILLTAVHARTKAPIALTFHPQTASLVREVMADVANVEVQLNEDQTLGPQEVYVGISGAESQIDVAGLIESLQSALSNIVSIPVGVNNHG